MALNIIDIAKLAGVSKSTVSRYLNNGYVSEESKNKIQKIIDETGFQPQRHAKSMRTKKTNLIGVIVPKISSETIARIVEGMTDIFSPKGYDVLIANTNLSIEKELEYLNIFKNNNVDGIMFVATKVIDRHIKVMDTVKVPIVVVAQKIDGYPSVYNDDYNAAKDSTKYLIDKQHKNIGFIGVYEEDISVGYYRKKGYIDGITESGIELKEEYIRIGEFTSESGYKLTKEIMESNKDVTAILAVTDNIAVGAIEYLRENNYRVPEDVAVMGMGDSGISKVVTPKLTTIHFNYKTSGKKSAEIMCNILDESGSLKKNNYKNIKLKYRLIERDSI